MSSRAPGQAALTTWPWDLDPELCMMEQGPQGGGQEGKTTGRQTPKLSTKNGRFEPWECGARGATGQMGKASGPPGAEAGPQQHLHTRFLCPASMGDFCLKRGLSGGK